MHNAALLHTQKKNDERKNKKKSLQRFNLIKNFFFSAWKAMKTKNAQHLFAFFLI